MTRFGAKGEARISWLPIVSKSRSGIGGAKKEHGNPRTCVEHFSDLLLLPPLNSRRCAIAGCCFGVAAESWGCVKGINWNVLRGGLTALDVPFRQTETSFAMFMTVHLVSVASKCSGTPVDPMDDHSGVCETTSLLQFRRNQSYVLSDTQHHDAGLEPVPEAAKKAQFLMHATFGPPRDSSSEFATMGRQEWIQREMVARFITS